MNELKFTQTHEWIEPGQTDMRVGISNHAQKLLGALVFVELPEAGRHVQAGEEIGVVESVKAASDFYAPITGTITAINSNLQDKPEMINEDPYGEGWLVRIKPDSASDLDTLLSNNDYLNLVEGE